MEKNSVTAEDRRAISSRMALSRPIPPLPGVDLSALITDAVNGASDLAPIIEPDGAPREGVLFITDDEIIAPLPRLRTVTELHSSKEFAVYDAVVDQTFDWATRATRAAVAG